jgi:hypothetical protein
MFHLYNTVDGNILPTLLQLFPNELLFSVSLLKSLVLYEMVALVGGYKNKLVSHS